MFEDGLARAISRAIISTKGFLPMVELSDLRSDDCDVCSVSKHRL